MRSSASAGFQLTAPAPRIASAVTPHMGTWATAISGT